jgi:hypothetical protein
MFAILPKLTLREVEKLALPLTLIVVVFKFPETFTVPMFAFPDVWNPAPLIIPADKTFPLTCNEFKVPTLVMLG